MTVRLKVRTRMDPRKLRHQTQRANIQSLGHAAAAIRLVARRSIKRRKRKSPEGQPPHTRRGQLKRAILYSVDKEKGQAVIGPDESIVGTAGAAHEHGGPYKGERYRKRPFMGPALEQIKPRLPKLWRGSVRS